MADRIAYRCTADGARLAHVHRPGVAPTVVFFCGFASNMSGTKALHLEQHCERRGQAFLRFDYQGHGASSGRFEDGGIGQWTDDALAVIEPVPGPMVFVGSSMGASIMVNVALAVPERVVGLVGVAAALDFTESWPARHPDAFARLQADGRVELASGYGLDPLVITAHFLEDGGRHLRLGAPIALRCPVRLIHGLADPDVPWKTSMRLAECLESTDVRLTLLKGAGHRLSAPAELGVLLRVLDEMLPGDASPPG